MLTKKPMLLLSAIPTHRYSPNLMLSSKRSLVLLVVLLIITNLSLLGILLFRGDQPSTKPNRFAERKAAMKARLQEQVGFSSEQLARYDSLSEAMYKSGKERMDAHRQYKRDVVIRWLSSNLSDSTRDSLANTLGNKQTALEIDMLAHIKRVRSLCTPAQLPAFDTVYPAQLFRRNGNK